MTTSLKSAVHVEVSLKSSGSLKKHEVVGAVKEKLRTCCPIFTNGSIELAEGEALKKLCEYIYVCDLEPGRSVSFWQAQLCIHAFSLSDQEPEKDFLEGEGELPASEQWELPNRLLCGLWDSIIIDETIKKQLLGYCSTSIRFADAGVDPSIISWNRMALLHGPPGTGKTTLCKALAQKVYIRNCDRYNTGVLLEINSHSLFSKWFSESGKLVMKLFDHISEIADDTDCFVTVLVDEVESITAARASAARSNEPGDAVRVVNAVLTSLDALKRRPNVLVLCTSNMVDSIDPAFRDRLDMQVYLGPPSLPARYQILRSCLVELTQRGLITASAAVAGGGDINELISLQYIEHQQQQQQDHGQESTFSSSAAGDLNGGDYRRHDTRDSVGEEDSEDIGDDSGEGNSSAVMSPEQLLHILATKTEGFSGRALRKLPLKAHAFYVQRDEVDLTEFLQAMLLTVENHTANTDHSCIS